MVPTFHQDQTFNNGLRQVNSVRLTRSYKCLFCGKSLVEFSEDEDAYKILKESFTNAGANLELKPKKVFDAGREREQEEFGNSRGHVDHKIAEQTGFLKRLICAFTWKKKSSGDDSNKQNGDQKQEIKVEASETNEGESVPSMSEEESNGEEINVEASETNEGESVPSMSEEGSNGKKIEKASENCANGAEKDNQSKENDGKDVKAEEKPSVGVDKNRSKAAAERKSVIETYKNNKNVRCEDSSPNFQRLCTKYINFHIGAESSYTEYEKPGEAQKARAAEVQTKSDLLVKNDIATLEPVSGEVKKEYWSIQVQGGQGRLHDKGHRGGKYNGNGKGRY